MSDLLLKLTEPFEPKHVVWKPGAAKGDKCLAMPYADLRAYMNRLDEVCGTDWSVVYEPWGPERIICRLNINGVTRSSTGEYDTQDEKQGMGGTVAEAQAFKRAASMFGLGRYLYDLPAAWVDFDASAKRISKAGLVELDTRYKNWYAKTMAATKRTLAAPEQPPRRVDTTTGEILEPVKDVEFGMGKATNGNGKHAENPFDADQTTDQEPEKPVASKSQLNKMHALGMEFHGSKDEWNAARPVWVKKASHGDVTSSKELSPKQADWIIASLEKRIAETKAESEAQTELEPEVHF